MDVTDESLHELYSQMDTEELINVSRNRDLTDSATRILNQILSERGVKEEDQITFDKEVALENKELKAEIGFQWWVFWAWLGLSLGNLYTFITFVVLNEQMGLAIFFIIINSSLMVLILKFNKYAFLIATILSLNPLLWIINGIYLKNRWNHPKVNASLGG